MTEEVVAPAEDSVQPPSVEQMKIDDGDDIEVESDKADAGTAPASGEALDQTNEENTNRKDDDDDVNVKDDDSVSTTDDDESSDADFSPRDDPELLLIKATTLKEDGNAYFKGKEFEKASRSYRRGTNTLKPLNRGNAGDEQVKALLVSLQTNLSMMCFKLGKHKQSAQVASAVLEIEGGNVKALYRRALAYRKMGNTEAAKTDLRQALQHDPANASVKKELASLKKELEQAKLAQKKGLQKAFRKSGGGLGLLYDDKEEEKRRKAEEAKLKKQREEELLKKRKVEWEDACVKRMAKGEPALSFEEWEKERKEKEKEEEKRKKEERRKAREAAKAAAKNEGNDSDEELTEKELAQLRGYKKTADGRVTSYFTREQSAHEKSLIGDIAPRRLEPSNAHSPTDVLSPAEKGKGNPSVWNQAGTTWEERNTTDWCRNQLEYRLKAAKSRIGESVAVVTGVEDLTGEASVAIASGKKRYIFDFHCKVKFQVRDPGTDDVLGTGMFKLPDICSTHHHELEVEWAGWKKKPAIEHATIASDCQTALVETIRESVKSFVDDFNQMY